MTLSPHRKAPRGFTVIESFIALAIFSGILVIVTMLLRQAVWVWTSGDSRESAMLVLRKARVAVARDLMRADLDLGDSGELRYDQTQTSAALGGGDAIWFLSNMGPNGEFYTGSDGYPFWQRNILYYMAKPNNHDALYNITCAAGSNVAGDDVCPHKLLLRVVIDYPAATLPPPPPGPGPPAGPVEEIIPNAEIGTYLLAPDGLDVSAIQSLPGVEDVRIVTTGLLWFKVAPAPGAPTAGLEIDLRATAVEEASKTTPVGSVSLLNVPYTLRSVFSLFPNN